MTIKFLTEAGTIEVPEFVVDAVVQQASRRADLTAATLQAMGFVEGSVWPAGFLIELGAVLELGFWELHGMRHLLDADLPTFAQAAKELAKRAKKGREAFQDLIPSQLNQKVLKVWMEQCAWNARQFLGTEIVVEKMDEDELVGILAQFLWENRHALSHLAGEE